VGDYRVDGSFGRNVRTVSFADVLDVLVVFAFEALRVMAEFFRCFVAVFLQRVDLAGEAAEDGDGPGEFFGSRGELLTGFGFGEKFGEMGSGRLEADFGNLAGIVLAKVLEEIFLEEPGFDGAVLFEAPVFVAAACFPIGDVAAGDVDAKFLESANDFFVGHIVLQHAVDHVAFGLRQAGDFAVAAFRTGGTEHGGPCGLD